MLRSHEATSRSKVNASEPRSYKQRTVFPSLLIDTLHHSIRSRGCRFYVGRTRTNLTHRNNKLCLSCAGRPLPRSKWTFSFQRIAIRNECDSESQPLESINGVASFVVPPATLISCSFSGFWAALGLFTSTQQFFRRSLLNNSEPEHTLHFRLGTRLIYNYWHAKWNRRVMIISVEGSGTPTKRSSLQIRIF
ncbi:hypothetical protein BJ508DRAFT_382040 [Ascobolus immersus RN42]|uniref:Uncharacterized protein n=1 Tax=Ascobolus immersus RN42 TaxID=1160509 RepID=A0A3N4H9Z3_ASCIM|nr:hypothetical protein BJ508DRAFT_382040 [Ascobolus immersus RN42]